MKIKSKQTEDFTVKLSSSSSWFSLQYNHHLEQPQLAPLQYQCPYAKIHTAFLPINKFNLIKTHVIKIHIWNNEAPRVVFWPWYDSIIVSNNAAPLVTQLNTEQYQLIIDLRCYFSHNIKHNILGPQWHTHWLKFGPNNPPLYTLWPPLPTQNSHPIKLMRLPISSLCWWSD